MSDNMELFKQFQDNPSFKKWLSDLVFNLTYNTEGKPYDAPDLRSAEKKIKMAKGKNINLFLMDGHAQGRIKCTLANWTGIAYKIPRTMLDKARDITYLEQTGIYFLFGTMEDSGDPVVYVGQAGVRKMVVAFFVAWTNISVTAKWIIGQRPLLLPLQTTHLDLRKLAI